MDLDSIDSNNPLDELLRGGPKNPLQRVLERRSLARIPPKPAPTSAPTSAPGSSTVSLTRSIANGRSRRSMTTISLATCAAICVVLLVLSFLRPNPVPVEQSLPSAGATPAGTAVLPGATDDVSSAEGTGSSLDSEVPDTAGDLAVPVRFIVHVAGAVNQPGLVTMGPDARVADAVIAAGGFRADADIDRLNLASPLSDGVRLYVATIGQVDVPNPEPLLSGSGITSPAGSGGSPGVADASKDAVIDINTATVEQLDVLPGVGPSTAAAIVSYREENGRFGSVEELQEVRGIGPAKFESMAAMVVVSR